MTWGIRECWRSIARAGVSGACLIGALGGGVGAQMAPGQAGDAMPGILPGVKMGGSPNMHLVAHVPLGGFFRVMDAEIEQEASRPYAYISQSRDRYGFTIIDLHDLKNVHPIYTWRIPNTGLHQGLGALRGRYFKINGACDAAARGHDKRSTGSTCARYYYVQGVQFSQGTPDANLGALVFDVTGLPDTSKIKLVTRIEYADVPGGFHNVITYKHSDGRVLLFTTTNEAHANVYDMEKVLAGGDPKAWKIGEIPVPETQVSSRFGRFGYHDFYIAYDAATHQDKFYGAGRGGYYVYDITEPEQPKLLTSITGSAGIEFGHTFTPTPDGKYAVAETEYQYAPLRIFDLQAGLEGKTQTIQRPIGAWTPDWHDLAHNHEVRWPFVFVSGYEDGLGVFSMVDPTHPTTVGWYYTCQCAHEHGFGGVQNWEGTSVDQGAFGIAVRNFDGLIMISDSNTGAWFFKMDGFDGWNGHDWGMPNVSSVQDWDHGPEGVSPRGRPAA